MKTGIQIPSLGEEGIRHGVSEAGGWGASLDLPEREEAFLNAIQAEPEDDSHPLGYADWLEERGKLGDRERADLIRIQVWLSRLPEGDPRRADLKQREGEILHTAPIKEELEQGQEV